MAKYSPIGPITILEQLQEQGMLGNYLLLLAHDVLEWPARYEELVRELGTDPDSFIMMDNSVVELGVPMETRDVIKAARIVNADAIMTAYIMYDSIGTQARVEDALSMLTNSEFDLMRIPQGETNQDLIECSQWLRDNVPKNEDGIEYWGISRLITNSNTMGSRVPIIQYINMTSEKPRFHLLGTSKDHTDDMIACTLPDVMGIDSANPVVAGFAGLDLSVMSWRHLPRGAYWEARKLPELSVKNVDYMRNAIRN